MVNLVPVTYQAPKELNDVRVCLVELIKDVKAGKSPAAIAAENLPLLLTMMSGIDQLPTEVREELAKSCETGGHMGGELLAVLLSPKV